MVSTLLRLPNGQTLTVTPSFAGYSFKANDLNVHHSVFPPGWAIIIESEDEDGPGPVSEEDANLYGHRPSSIHRYHHPTWHHDNLFISSISSPSSNDFRPASSPSRQMAMMLWATLYWYFHQNPPSPPSENTDTSGVSKSWRINITREGIFKSKTLFSKFERMGILSTEESCVGARTDDPFRSRHKMFMSQRAFWQLDPRLFLFTLEPTKNSPFPGQTPLSSRPGSPNREITGDATQAISAPESPSPYKSTSHLPTYYPPPPPQYVVTKGIEHPLRSQPPAQGEIFYTRYVPSVGQYLSFRTASLSHKPPPKGPVSTSILPPFSNLTITPIILNDTELLHKWMNIPRVNAAWGAAGTIDVQEALLKRAVNDKHSFPVIGCWDGKPFGYFEVYWVAEDNLGRHLNEGETSDYDRGFHALVGEEEFRGQHRVDVWMSALVHYCWLADPRTQRVYVEPNADNEKFISYLHKAGFHKKREISFPHKKAALMAISRKAWVAPAL